MAGDPRDLQRRERFAGLLLIAAAAAALILANSPFAGAYHSVLELELGPAMPRFGMMSIHQWIADGLMAIFFLLIGLEVKREWYDGQLSTPAERRLPIIAAAAGMAVPALIYLATIGFEPALARGWAIPSATDIAFAIGVLALLGTRANPAIKLLLVTIAIIDDVGAVIIIATVYTSGLDISAILSSLVLLAGMTWMNRSGVTQLWLFMLGFALLWMAMLASGIHPTIAGVLGALTIPLGPQGRSPLKRLEHAIHPWVMFGVMPLFGLASAGVHIGGFGEVIQPLPLAILLGLFLGKQLGVFGAIWVTVRAAIAPKPKNARWAELYGASVLCGIGFTMSLFIGNLAFPESPETVEMAKLGTLAGSVLSALLGFAVLRLTTPARADEEEAAEASEIFAADQPEVEQA